MAAPGWYDDPDAPGGKRWWDGTQWTEHRAPAQAPTTQAAQPAAGPGPFGAARPAAAPAAAGAARAEPAGTGYPAARIAVAAGAGFCLLLLLIGSVGTWASVQTMGPFSVGATKGGLDGDGVLTLIIAIICLVLVGLWAARVGPPVARVAYAGVAAFLALVALGIALVDVADVSDSGNSFVDSSVGWGLWLTVIASLGLLACTAAGAAVRNLR